MRRLRARAIESSSSTIWLASSRVGARTRAGDAGAGLEQVDQRDAEGERLARAGRGLDEQVVAGERVADDHLLDGERLR